MRIVQDDEWIYFPNFIKEEFACHATGKCEMTFEFMSLLQKLRTAHGRPIKINSGYRDPSHPDEKNKPSPGEHTYGCAADICAVGIDALEVLSTALTLGFKRIGVKQHGHPSSRFIHLGIGDRLNPKFPKSIWSYP